MMAALHHRGPDDEGLLVAGRLGVGTRRLSIIDLPGGNQPIWNESNTLAVIFNGEIYNFRELRRELEAKGHRFRTSSDTEVIVHAYEEWEKDCLAHLRGMFAFAIVEMPEGPAGTFRRAILARDRLGIKPLYYSALNGVFLFASEVRALLASGYVEAQLCRSSLPSYLLFGSVGEPTTLVDGVLALPPGHYLEISRASGPVVPFPTPYWNLEVAKRSPAARDARGDPSPAKRLRPYLENNVREHLVADVPLGVFLSGGIDSTAIAALASRERGGIETFTVAFPEEDFSEAKIARRTAQRLGTRHSEFLLSGDETRERLEEAVSAFDQPSMDGINTYFVSWAARQAGLKVALSGLGSDEIFGGYSTFRSTPRLERLAAVARAFPRTFRSTAACLLETIGVKLRHPDAARKLAEACSPPNSFLHPYFLARGLFTSQTTAALLGRSPELCASTHWWNLLAEEVRAAEGLDRFGQISWLELRSYLVNTLLRDTDAMSMHHSLEVRVPFLDHRLVEFALSLPESAKRRRRAPKSLLVEALGNLLPEEIVARPKRTFTFPWEKWLRNPLKGRVEAGMAEWSPVLEPLLGGQTARVVWKDFLAGKTSWSRPWSLYVLNEWVKKNLQSSRKSEPMGRPAAAISAA